jgi:hypothetical protein
MSSSWQSRNVPFCPRPREVHGILPDPVKRGRAMLASKCAGINRHVLGDERALRERSSDSIPTSSLAWCVVRRTAKPRRGERPQPLQATEALMDASAYVMRLPENHRVTLWLGRVLRLPDRPFLASLTQKSRDQVSLLAKTAPIAFDENSEFYEPRIGSTSPKPQKQQANEPGNRFHRNGRGHRCNCAVGRSQSWQPID